MARAFTTYPLRQILNRKQHPERLGNLPLLPREHPRSKNVSFIALAAQPQVRLQLAGSL